MLQELATQSGATAWAVGSMLFFLCVWAVLAVRTWRAQPERMQALANQPLSDD
jgi:hypothetical protein